MLYSFVQYFFVTSIHAWELKEVSTEELILDIQEAEKKEQSDDIQDTDAPSRFQSVLWFFTFNKKTKREELSHESLFEEIIETQVEEDGFDIQIDQFEDSLVDKKKIDNEKEILMTEQTAKEIDNITRSAIQREEFNGELQYLKKKWKWEEFEKKLIEWLAKDNEHPEIIEQLAQYYIDQKQHKKALPLLKKLLDQDADNHKVLRQMADIYLTIEDVETSEVLVKRALSLNPKNPKYAITLVEIYYNTKRKDDAITLMEDIVKRRPANLWYRDTLAKLYEEMHDYDLAVECYQSMLTIDPKNTAIKRKLLETRTKIS
jgi:tetratricopeptide (TPR) repeat protein